jgi:hypothetical protein
MISPLQREFLFVAGFYLACRFMVFGGQLEGIDSDLEGCLLGLHDNEHELRLLLLSSK